MRKSTALYKITALGVFVHKHNYKVDACNRVIFKKIIESFLFLEFLQVSSPCMSVDQKKVLVPKNHRWIFVQLQVYVLIIKVVASMICESVAVGINDLCCILLTMECA